MPVFCNEPISAPLHFSLGLPAVSQCYCFKARTLDKPSHLLLSESNKGHFYCHNSKTKVTMEDPLRPLYPLRSMLQCTWDVNPAHYTDVNPSLVFHKAFPSIKSLKNQEADDTFLDHWLISK